MRIGNSITVARRFFHIATHDEAPVSLTLLPCSIHPITVDRVNEPTHVLQEIIVWGFMRRNMHQLKY